MFEAHGIAELFEEGFGSGRGGHGVSISGVELRVKGNETIVGASLLVAVICPGPLA
jgi:hypothetical protein